MLRMKVIILITLLLHTSEQTENKFYNETTSLPIEAQERIQSCVNEGLTQGVQEEYLWQVKLACLSSYYSDLEPNDLDENDKKLFKEAEESRFGFRPPPTGFRTRREVRTLTDEEWQKTSNVFIEMYKRGILRAFGKHHAYVGPTAHHGAAFLLWHRVFLTHFEEEMRKIDPTVSLPYWDYTADFYIAKPTESVVWTDCFFGNDSSVVSVGPFKKFYGTHYSFISRKANSDCFGKLISHEDIAALMEFCSIVNITTGRQSLDAFLNSKHNLELLHDEVHDWVGGDMGVVKNSAFDPIFYMHHAYIDYIFEEFRQHQNKSCNNVNLEHGYRQKGDMCLSCNDTSTSGQGPNEYMYGYPLIKNIDGMWLNWTTAFYNYSVRPSCPDNCNGKYLYCNTTLPNALKERFPHGICTTKTRSACPVNNRNKRNAEAFKPIEPKLSCSAEGIRFNVLKGDGRNRRMSLKDSWAALREYFETFFGTNEDVIAANKNDSNPNGIGITFGILFGIETIGILIYCIRLYKGREEGAQFRNVQQEMN